MLKLNDSLWSTFVGGYRTIYNASPLLQELESGTRDTEEIWAEFWDELHHQGDVDVASYAAAPQLVRIGITRNLLEWNLFALVATIEECRLFGKNPPVPKWLEADYHSALKQLAEFGARKFATDWPAELTQAFLAVVAFANGAQNTGRSLIEFSDEEMKDVFEKFIND